MNRIWMIDHLFSVVKTLWCNLMYGNFQRGLIFNPTSNSDLSTDTVLISGASGYISDKNFFFLEYQSNSWIYEWCFRDNHIRWWYFVHQRAQIISLGCKIFEIKTFFCQSQCRFLAADGTHTNNMVNFWAYRKFSTENSMGLYEIFLIRWLLNIFLKCVLLRRHKKKKYADCTPIFKNFYKLKFKYF